MYRVGIILKNGEILSDNFPTKEDCDTYILEKMEKHELKRAIIVNKEKPKERYIENF